MCFGFLMIMKAFGLKKAESVIHVRHVGFLG